MAARMLRDLIDDGDQRAPPHPAKAPLDAGRESITTQGTSNGRMLESGCGAFEPNVSSQNAVSSANDMAFDAPPPALKMRSPLGSVSRICKSNSRVRSSG